MEPSAAELTFFCQSALTKEGWRRDVRLRVKDGIFTAIESEVAPGAADHRLSIALPGMANLHSHSFQRFLAGLAEKKGPAGDSFWTWREVMYRYVGQLGPEDLQAIAAMAFLEMVESGFTQVAEFHYLHHGADGHPYDDPAEMSRRIAAAAADAGIGLTLLPVFYAQGGFGARPPGAAQARFLHDPESFARLIDGCRDFIPPSRVGLAPHSLRAVTREQLRDILPLAALAPIHIHIAEQLREVEECLAWSGARPVTWLLEHAPVDHRWCLVHATHIDAPEMAALAASGAVAGLCPITEANLGDGLFPLPEFQALGGRFGIGSDSNVLISLAEELRLLEYGQRLTRFGRNIAARAEGEATGHALFVSSVDGGAQALGQKGGLTVGATADLVSLDPDHPSLIARAGDSWLDSLIFAGAAIDEVWCAGRRQVSGGRHHQRVTIMASYRDRLRRLLI